MVVVEDEYEHEHEYEGINVNKIDSTAQHKTDTTRQTLNRTG